MSSERRVLVAGLGNPGKEYSMTRHNIGFIVIEALSAAHFITLSKKKFETDFGIGTISDRQVILAKPLAYMNRSGPPLRRLSDFLDVALEDVLVIHDDIDLEFSRIKIKSNGGHGGHNGMRSIIETFGTDRFSRIRLGVGRPDNRGKVTGHVLGRFSAEENQELDAFIRQAVEAIETILSKGIVAGMNMYN